MCKFKCVCVRVCGRAIGLCVCVACMLCESQQERVRAQIAAIKNCWQRKFIANHVEHELLKKYQHHSAHVVMPQSKVIRGLIVHRLILKVGLTD